MYSLAKKMNEMQNRVKRLKPDSHTDSLVSDSLPANIVQSNMFQVQKHLPASDNNVPSNDAPTKDSSNVGPAVNDEATVPKTATVADGDYSKLPRKPTHYKRLVQEPPKKMKRVEKAERKEIAKEVTIGRPKESLD